MKLAWALALALFVSGCEREARTFEPPAPGARVGTAVDRPEMLARYERNAYELANGKRLFNWYNCVGCHGNGGGASGPALMDDVWIYGSDPLAIYQTIVEGRPNGMPSFGNRIPEDEIWQLVAYVRSLSGLAPKNASPSRDDALQVKRAENRMQPAPSPVVSATSGSSKQP
jgi:cytochrome c oxidase cbb3-type subunit 3